MKTLFIVRHAKSSWEYNVPDDERPLLQKGIKRTNKIAAYLLQKNIKPDLIISSHAVRALDTAKIIAEAIGYPEEKISISPQVYHGGTDQLYDELFNLSDDIQSVMLFGHNPTFTSFANHFLDRKIEWLPTSAVVSIIFKTDTWVKIPMCKRSTNFVITPREL